MNALGSVPAAQPFVPNPYSAENAYAAPSAGDSSVNFGSVPAQQPQPSNLGYNYTPNVAAPVYDPYNTPGPNAQFQSQVPPPYNPGMPTPVQAGQPGGQFAMFQQPIVQDMALQYGQKLADQGKQLVESNFEKYVPVTRLKYYFAVDNKYVINKLRLIFFPFTHKVSTYLLLFL